MASVAEREVLSPGMKHSECHSDAGKPEGRDFKRRQAPGATYSEQCSGTGGAIIHLHTGASCR
eukprot:15470773-Alexandrium_andersonii.AAC.1